MPEQKLDINLPEEIAKGTYSIMPGLPKSNVCSRIIMTPQNAKRLLRALADNISKFEEQNGVIVDQQETIPPMMNGGALA